MSSLRIQLKLNATLIACPEGGYTSFCPQIKGAVSQGETEEEALANLVDAIEGLMEINAEIDAESREAAPAAARRMVYELLPA